MTKWGLQSIETYELVQYSRQTPCYVCDGANRFDADFCRHCRAPLALSYQTVKRKHAPQLVAVIGAAGAGKTAYLGMLTDILSRQHGPLQILARGAFSVSLQQASVSALARRNFPDRTPLDPERWNWVHCELTGPKRRHPIELVMPDISGEALTNEVEQAHSVPAIRSFLQKCSAALVLLDAEQIEGGGTEPDFLAMKIVSFLLELDANSKGWSQRPVAFVFTKADRCEDCFENPGDYAQRHMPGSWRIRGERLKHSEFFAATVVGACARFNILGESLPYPLRIEPRGIVEPFAWLVQKLPK